MSLEALRTLWQALGNIPLNYADDGSTLVAIPGVSGSEKVECIDEDFHLWKHGTDKDEIWEWFDEEYARYGTCLGDQLYRN